MKYALAFSLTLLLMCPLLAQEEASVWYFGIGAGLDFSNGDPVVLENGVINTIEGCASISDEQGDLLFYSDGISVFNRNHEKMPNGSGLKGHSSSTQSGIVVPAPLNPNLYYLFTAFYQAQGGMYYSVIDMTRDGGMGDITRKNVLLKNPATEKLTAVMHENGNDVWVIGHDWGNDAFMAYLVTPNGVSEPVISNVGFDLNYSADNADAFKAKGYLKASPDSRKIVAAHSFIGVELFDFDNATGKLTNPQVLMQSSIKDFYGLEFSPSSEMLYLTIIEEDIYQFNLKDADPVASMHTINFPASTSGGMQLGPNGKIYLSSFGSLSVINNPDAVGDNADFEFDAIDLGNGKGTLGLPPFISSYFKAGILADNFCFGSATEFTTNTYGEAITSIMWNFGDGETSNEESPTHLYDTPGNYEVEVLINIGSKSVSESHNITIYETPIANKPNDLELCSETSQATTDLTSKNTEILGGQSASNFTIEYYPTEAAALTRTNILPYSYPITTDIQTVYAVVYNNDNASCYSVTNFDIKLSQGPVISAISDWNICDVDTDGVYAFDLSQKDSEILNGQNTSMYAVRYYLTWSDASNDENAIASTFENTTATQKIYARVYNALSPTCFVIGDFTLGVTPSISVNNPENIKVCDDDNDGFSIFDFSYQIPYLLSGKSASALNITYHISLIDAQNGDNPVNSTAFTNTEAYGQTMYIRVYSTTNNDCYAIASFDINIYDSPQVETVSDWWVCEPNFDGKHVYDFTEKDAEILGDLNATDFTVSYYSNESDANLGQNALKGNYQNTAVSETISYKVTNNANADCYLVGHFSIGVFEAATATNASPLISCDLYENGVISFDLSEKDAEILNGQSEDNYRVIYFASEDDAVQSVNPLSKNEYINTTTEEEIFARVENKRYDGCYAIASFALRVIPLPQPNIEEVYTVCGDNPNLVINGGDFVSWSWRNEEDVEIAKEQVIEIEALGIYSLTVAHDIAGVTCEQTVYFEVVASQAPETLDITTEGFSDTVIINAAATGVDTDMVEYSIDGFVFQDSGRFEVFPGEHIVYARDKAQCRTIQKTIHAVGYGKFFTPNGDGIHEHWNVIGTEVCNNSTLRIYDKYGKLLANIPPKGLGWDGTFGGKPMPASDYWFKFSCEMGEFTGHFTLKR